MTEKQLIHNLKELKAVKPRQDWVVLNKKRIMGEEPARDWIDWMPVFQFKLALAPVISVLIIIGLFGFAQSTVPGDFLFSVKKITENVQVGFSSAVEKPKAHIHIANKRLEELSRIAETNRVRNLGPAIEEFQANIAEAVKGLAQMDTYVTSSDPVVLKELAEETQKLEENKEKIEKVLGTQIGDTGDLENALACLEEQTAVYLLADLEQRTLSEEDQELLVKAQEDFEAGNYSEALEKIWLLSNK